MTFNKTFLASLMLLSSSQLHNTSAFTATTSIGSSPFSYNTQRAASTLDETEAKIPEEEEETNNNKKLDINNNANTKIPVEEATTTNNKNLMQDIIEKLDDNISFADRLTNSGDAAVSMKSSEAPSVEKSFIALDKSENELDEEGLTLVCNKDLIQAYWSKEYQKMNIYQKDVFMRNKTAVSMKSLEAPSVEKSFIALDKSENELDEEGLTLVCDKDLIQAYWSKEYQKMNIYQKDVFMSNKKQI